MADFTHFRFTQLGERAVTKVNGIIASIGVWYNQGLPVTTEKADNAHLGEPYDTLKYQATDGTLISNEATISVNFPPDKLTAPASSDVILTSTNGVTINLEDHIIYNAAVDRIKIISFTTNVGELEFFGVSVFPNQVIMQYDLAELKFNTLTGNGDPYQIIYFKVGNINGFSATTYSLRINIIGQASLLEVVTTNDINATFKFVESSLKIEGGFVNGTAKLKMNINLDAAAWPGINNDNFAYLNTSGISEDVNANGDTIVDFNIDETGEALINFSMYINLLDLPINGNVTFTLLEINGTPANVSATDEVIIPIAF